LADGAIVAVGEAEVFGIKETFLSTSADCKGALASTKNVRTRNGGRLEWSGHGKMLPHCLGGWVFTQCCSLICDAFCHFFMARWYYVDRLWVI